VLNLVIFLVVTAAIVALSWKSLKIPRSHGFFRFFAFELILVLILLNAEHWFQELLSPRQVVSLLLAVHAFYLFRLLGKQGPPPRESANLEFENTSRLITTGAYRYIRHPMYSSVLLFAWGAFLKDVSALSILVTLLASVFLYTTARVEERENVQRFGGEYGEYIKETKMFIPYLF
jgi:protein-S-isoprenylcysteine O-methyltransferase Ste14